MGRPRAGSCREARGPLLEGLVLTILRAHNGNSELFGDLSYWTPAQARHTEVDFLLRRGREFLAVEVKAQPRFSTPQLAGLRAIGELLRLARRILVYLGERQLRTETESMSGRSIVSQRPQQMAHFGFE